MAIRRRRRTKNKDFTAWLDRAFPLATKYHMQELSGAVALATNDALALGRNILVDGDMEAVGVGAWTPSNSPTLTKETGSPHGGTQVLRIARTTVNNPAVTQSILRAGKTYIITGWSRSDGNAQPRVFVLGPGILWTGTTSTSWQPFSLPFTAETDTRVFLQNVNSSGTEYIEYDDVSVKQTGILASSVYPGPELLVNGDFATGDLTGWVAVGTPTTLEVVMFDSSYQCHIVADSAFDGVRSDIVIGADIGLRIVAEFNLTLVSGTCKSQITQSDDGGTVHTSSGRYKKEATITAAFSRMQFFSEANGDEWYIDNVTFREANPMNGDNTALTVGVVAPGNVGFLYSGNASTSVLNIYSAELNSKMDWSNGGILMVTKIDTWAAGIDVLVRLAVDDNNEILIFRDGSDLVYEYRQASTSVTVTIDTTALPGGSPTGEITVGIDWDVTGVGMRALLNGVQHGGDQAIAAAIIGNLNSTMTVVFAGTSAAANSWAGDGGRLVLPHRTPLITEHAAYHDRSGLS